MLEYCADCLAHPHPAIHRTRLVLESEPGPGIRKCTVAALAVYALLTNPLLLIAIGFLSGGFVAINKFGECIASRLA